MNPLPAAFLTTPIAHRAFHNRAAGRPENSRGAIRAAIEAGYGIEIDVQLSADGQAMVFHDYDLGRLTNQSGPVRTRTEAELSAIHLKDAPDGIPTLPEVLSIIDGKVPLLIEIKDQDGAMGPDVGPLEQATADALRHYRGPVAIMSFNPHAVAAFHAAAPELPVGLTTSAYDPADWAPLPKRVCDRLRDIPDYDRCHAGFISHEASDLNRPRVAELKTLGATILCWTINSQAAEDEARKIADNVTFEGYSAATPAA
jgi:glycerophosphoryl diester phosphodiesterase